MAGHVETAVVGGTVLIAPEDLPASPAIQSALVTTYQDEGSWNGARRSNEESSPKDQVPPFIPRKSSKRYGKISATQRRYSPISATVGIGQRLPLSKTTALNPLAMNPTRLAPSTSVPLGKLTKQLEGRMPQGTNPAVTNHKEINRKVAQMLAATEALKPQPAEPQRAASPTAPSRMSRLMKKRVFRNFSNALANRFHPKNNKESKTRGDVQGSSDDGPDELAQELPIPLPTTNVMIPVTEINAKERTNRNSKKVQHTAGGRIPRKPLPEDGKSNQSRVSLDDPFAEPAFVKRVPTLFESRLRKKSISISEKSILPNLPETNPFTAKNVLDANPESAVGSLSLASSTPKSWAEGARVTAESPTKRSQVGTLTYACGTPCSASAAEEQERSSSDFDAVDLQQSLTTAGVSYTNIRLRTSRFTYIPISSLEDGKKHPSPNKSDLELLERQLRLQYPELGLAAHDEKDELADSVAYPPMLNPLAVRDKNRQMAHPMSHDSYDTDISEASIGEAKGRVLPAVSKEPNKPHPLRRVHLPHSHTAPRLPCHPLEDDAMDLDELQWDNAPHNLGMQQVF